MSEAIEIPADTNWKVGAVTAGSGLRIGRGSRISVDELLLGDGVEIGSDVVIDAERVELGHRARIGNGCRVAAIGGRGRCFRAGDYFLFGERNLSLLPSFVAGDYVSVHHDLLMNGYSACAIGHNTWVGQNCVLNATDKLCIGNNVGIGAYTSIYTHAFNGELLEGCQVFNKAPVTIADNAWLVGSYNVVSPGVTIGPRAMILSSSVVSRDVPEGHCVGGIPARDLTDRIRPFRDLSIGGRVELMRRFVMEFGEEVYPGRFKASPQGIAVAPEGRRAFFVEVQETLDERTLSGRGPGAVYAGTAGEYVGLSEVTVFDLTTKTYRKLRTEIEIDLIRFMNGYRARFVPHDEPRVEAEV
jgi:acetyltransferase-like isoleucine patch superfamily enzyme